MSNVINLFLGKINFAIEDGFIFVDEVSQTSFWAKFSNNVAMSLAFVNIVTFNNIGMINKL